MSKLDHISKMLEMQRKIKNEKQEIVDKVEEKDKEEEIKGEEEETNLPSKYLSLNQMKLSVKEVNATSTYLDKLRNKDSAYDKKQIEAKKAEKIVRQMSRLTAGTVAVAPLKCKGSQCTFKSDCVSGDTVISGPRSKKIRDIKEGDSIYSFNVETKRIEKDTVSAVIEHENKKSLYLITTWYGNKIKITEDHRVLTTTGSSEKLEWRTIKEGGLKKGSKILLDDIEEYIEEDLETVGDSFVDIIMDITKVKEDYVYDITVKNNANFFGNNILVHNCAFYQNNEHILEESCPVEENLLLYWTEKYIKEYNIDENSITDLHAVGRLCTYDLYEMRLTRYLSEHDQSLLVDFVSGVDEEGREISNKTTSPAWDTIEKIDRMRSRTLKELMATREAKIKIVQTVSDAAKTNSFSEMKKRFEKLVKQVDPETGKVVEGSTIEHN